MSRAQQFLNSISEGIEKDGWKLVYKDGKPVEAGAKVKSSNHNMTYSVAGGTPPHKAGSTGRVRVKTEDGGSTEFFPTVFDMKWVKE